MISLLKLSWTNIKTPPFLIQRSFSWTVDISLVQRTVRNSNVSCTTKVNRLENGKHSVPTAGKMITFAINARMQSVAKYATRKPTNRVRSFAMYMSNPKIRFRPSQEKTWFSRISTPLPLILLGLNINPSSTRFNTWRPYDAASYSVRWRSKKN